MKRMKIRTTVNQRSTLSELKKRIAELDHYIFPVAPWYRRHHLDFVAVPKRFPEKILLVRATQNGNVSIRPFTNSSTRNGIRHQLQKIRFPVPARWNGVKIPSREGSQGWHEYLSRSSRMEYAQLTGRLIT